VPVIDGVEIVDKNLVHRMWALISAQMGAVKLGDLINI
jgi:hypothetical protein